MLLSLILILATSGFVAAESTSDTRIDFYVSALSTDSSEQNFFSNTTKSKHLVTYGIIASIALAVIVLISQKILKHKEKIKREKFQKVKKARRKK